MEIQDLKLKSEITTGEFGEDDVEEYTVVEVNFSPEAPEDKPQTDDVQMFYCNDCDYSTKRKSDLKRHRVARHEGIRKAHHFLDSTKLNGNFHKYKCTECDYSTKRASDLKRHKEGKHQGIRYLCNECGHSTSDKSGLKRHKDSLHKKIKFPCDHCEFAGSTANNLTRHKQRKHGEVLSELPVPEIEINLLQPEQTLTVVSSEISACYEHQPDHVNGISDHLTKDEKPNLEVNQHSLDQCHQTFTKKELLETHKQSNNVKSTHKKVGRTYSCDKCGYSTSRPSDLNRHVQSRHDGIKYVCEFCQHKFCDLSTLNRHIKLKHAGDRETYSCD